MPTYEYRCPNLHVVTLVLPSAARDDLVGEQCETCGELLKRRWTPFRVAAPFEGHFNLGTGTYVESKRQLDEANRIASAERTQRLGLETNFVAHDVRDLSPSDMGVTEDGLNTTHDAQVAAGVKESKGRFVF
jgi:predicted nucleic acid-binding Zn ribbon protein